ncbi:MAG: flagellar biosynthesis protein FlhB [Lachnospiraceae bacterium]|jgi:flagellar biosynthetic protein FlhB|nr:flagellar biosynthesis protein FlhB [Lachnospiraceae bacterium]
MIEKKKKRYYYNLQLFAKDGPGGEKTEPATAKKLENARKEGQVAKSKELGNAVALLALFVVLKIFIGSIGEKLMGGFNSIYAKIPDITGNSNRNFTIQLLHNLIMDSLLNILLLMLPIFGIGVLVAFLVDLVQVKWKVTTKPMKPKFSKLNPLSGFKRIFSMRSLVELLKSVLIIIIIVYVSYTELKDKFIYLFYLYDITIPESLVFIGNLILGLGLKISAIFLIVGFGDLAYQKHKFKEDQKMTKQEVKDEFKNSEGDPQVKGQIRQKMRQASQRRMMQSVPQADVVITNPTHFAVAIKYDPETASAPILLAKGEDYLAQKIKEAARENQIEIVENKPLARAIYFNVEIGAQIPPELYQAVAEVLAFVYKVKNKAQ